jgi:putative oxidoreductase
MSSIARIAPLGLALLRIVAGALFLQHGLIKLIGFPLPGAIPFDDVLHWSLPGAQLWIGAVIETLTGALLILGLFTRFAAFIASGQTAVAYWQFHFHYPDFVYPASQNPPGGETAILFCFIFFYIFFAGPGILSLDGSPKK